MQPTTQSGVVVHGKRSILNASQQLLKITDKQQVGSIEHEECPRSTIMSSKPLAIVKRTRRQESSGPLIGNHLLSIRNAVSSLSEVPINDLLIKRKYKSKSKLHLSGGL